MRNAGALTRLAKDARPKRILSGTQQQAEAAWRAWADVDLAHTMSTSYVFGSNAIAIEGGDADIGTRVAEYVQERIADLISVDGSKSVVASTQQALSDLIIKAVADEWTPAQLAEAIEQDTVFSAERALVIARTELSAAEYAGALGAMTEAGVQLKAWEVDDSSHDKDDECDDNADDGDIDIGDAFSTGDFAPPAHPNCNCTLVAVSDGEAN